MDYSDQHLLDRLRERDRQALLQVYERYSARLFGFLVRLTSSRELAEDLFQDTWCQLAISANRLRPETDLWAWLLTVGRNAYYDRARGIARHRTIASDGGCAELVSDEASAPDATSAAREQLLLLEQALAQLSDLDKEVLLLVGVEGLAYERAAGILGIDDAALRKRLSRARQRLEAGFAARITEHRPIKGASRV